MFTRYKGTGIPENYSGVRFREAAQHTEMKTHKPSPSYTSTKTSVSPMFRSAQLQRNQENFDKSGIGSNANYSIEEARKNSFEQNDLRSGRENSREDFDKNFSTSQQDDMQGAFDGARRDFNGESRDNIARDEKADFYGQNDNFREGVYEKREKRDDDGVGVRGADENKKAHKSTDLRAELGGLLNKVLGGIKSDDFILLAVIFLLLGGEGGASKSAILPLALLLLYS